MNTSLLPMEQADYYRYRLGNFTGTRKAYFYDDYWIQQKNIHFISQPEIGLRLLEHFYTFIHFQSEEMDRYYKRFVRDYIHYNDLIFCKAAIIVNKLLRESANYRNDSKGVYSSFHVRRGDLQYKEVKIPADWCGFNVFLLVVSRKTGDIGSMMTPLMIRWIQCWCNPSMNSL
jgi:hypothetical protein